jgi:hypothetical protein
MVGYRVRGRSRPGKRHDMPLYRVRHFAPRLAAFAQELQQLGWTIGSSLQID